MTTTVKVLIEGNKKCRVAVVDGNGNELANPAAREVSPGTFTTVLVSGDQTVSVTETGEFL